MIGEQWEDMKPWLLEYEGKQKSLNIGGIHNYTIQIRQWHWDIWDN